MIENNENIFPKTYRNPVYSENFPDPFVLKFCGEYFAYCTGLWHDGKAFGVLRSRDLVNWSEIGGAMQKLENDAPFYWAPEVTYSNGKFYLYYSVGNEILMEIRVAVSDNPEGGFVDSGKKLTTEDFAIDGHVFTEPNGTNYFFYATDFLNHSHIGTGVVVDKMLDFYTLEGNPRPVTRAKYDWQVYDPQRKEKGGVRWHTVEGAFVLKRKGIYYEMFSGGNWQNPTYGVSFAVTYNIETPNEWCQFSDGEAILPILRTLPEKVIGPGHNSVIRGVNNQEIFCVYHRRIEDERKMAIDRMDFTGGARIFVRGATDNLQPAPFKPELLDFFDKISVEDWEVISGDWKAENNQIIVKAPEAAEIACRKNAVSFLLEISLRLIEGENGNFGIILKDDETKILEFLLTPKTNVVVISCKKNDDEKLGILKLPADFDFQAFHLLQVEVDHFSVQISLDERSFFFEPDLLNIPRWFSLAAEKCQAAFAGAALTFGFENLFEKNELSSRGWRKLSSSGEYKIENHNLKFFNRGEKETVICKEIFKNDYEITVNFRIDEIFDENFSFRIFPSFDDLTQTTFFSLEKNDNNWVLKFETLEKETILQLPENFSPEIFHQFTFLKISNKIFVRQENKELGVVEIPKTNPRIAFLIQNVSLVFDMIRVTAL